MPDIDLTHLAEIQYRGLRGRHRKAAQQFLTQLSNDGCQAMDYRLTGDHPVDMLCCKHLYKVDRAVVAFEEPDLALEVAIGPHDNSSDLNIYRALWSICGLDDPPAGSRTKPPCCNDSGVSPELNFAELEEIRKRAKDLARSGR